jgi:uncharacterized membrane protein
MSDRPLFIYVAAYETLDDAQADYEQLLELHAEALVGSYDVAIISKDEDGKVHVHKHEKPTQHGAWAGIGVGAVVGILFPPSLIASAIVGGGAGAAIGHLARGMSRKDMHELGDVLDQGQAALVVVGESRVEEQYKKALGRARESLEKEIDANADELKKALRDAEKEAVGD